MHGDLRSPNVFVAQDGHAKVGDFGFAQLLGEANERSMCWQYFYSGKLLNMAIAKSPNCPRARKISSHVSAEQPRSHS